MSKLWGSQKIGRGPLGRLFWGLKKLKLAQNNHNFGDISQAIYPALINGTFMALINKIVN